MSRSEFRGVMPYLVSPIGDDGSIDRAVLGSLVEHLIGAGVHGLTPLGSTGEFAYLSAEQRREVVETTLTATKGRVPVIPGVAATTTADAVRQARDYAALGADGLLVILEAYFPVEEDGVVDYFKAVAEAVSLPIVLYTNPAFQRSDLSLRAIARLAEIPNIRYVKDASTNTGRLLSIIDAVGDRMSVFAASSHITAAVMLIGGVGWMAGPACLVPRRSVELYDLCAARRWDEAMALQRRLWRINQVFARYALAGAVKTGLQLQGFAVGDPLAPQPPLDAAARAELREVLVSLDALDPACA